MHMAIDDRDIIQVDATVIAGLLVLFTITTISSPIELSSKSSSPSTVKASVATVNHNLQSLFELLRLMVIVYSMVSIIPFAYSARVLIEINPLPNEEEHIKKMRSARHFTK